MSEKRVGEAREIGQGVARDAMKLREETLKRCEAMRPKAQAMFSAAVSSGRLTRLSAGGQDPTLLAEGDSWFHYPGADILDLLEDAFGYEVCSVAHRGDRLEDMAYDPRQLVGFARQVEKLHEKGVVPVAVLLSAGGNDIAGEEFGLLLDHARSPAPGLNDEVVRGVIDVRLRDAYMVLISAITDLCNQGFGEAVPILLHGYGYAVPDGRGFLGGWGPLPGPWLRPGFRSKGYPDDPLAPRTQIVADLIDRFNEMLGSLPADFGHLHYVNLRALLPSGQNYRDWWDNELHPERQGFEAVTAEIAGVLTTLP